MCVNWQLFLLRFDLKLYPTQNGSCRHFIEQWSGNSNVSSDNTFSIKGQTSKTKGTIIYCARFCKIKFYWRLHGRFLPMIFMKAYSIISIYYEDWWHVGKANDFTIQYCGMSCMKNIKHACFFFVCLLTTKNPTSASSVWRNSENIIHTSAYQIPTNSKSYQARNTKKQSC